jgi:hypothetical protein
VLSKLFLGFAVDFMEPLFGAVSTIAIPIELILQLRNMIFGGSQLLRNLLSCRYRAPGIIFRNAGCLSISRRMDWPAVSSRSPSSVFIGENGIAVSGEPRSGIFRSDKKLGPNKRLLNLDYQQHPGNDTHNSANQVSAGLPRLNSKTPKQSTTERNRDWSRISSY